MVAPSRIQCKHLLLFYVDFKRGCTLAIFDNTQSLPEKRAHHENDNSSTLNGAAGTETSRHEHMSGKAYGDTVKATVCSDDPFWGIACLKEPDKKKSFVDSKTMKKNCLFVILTSIIIFVFLISSETSKGFTRFSGSPRGYSAPL